MIGRERPEAALRDRQKSAKSVLHLITNEAHWRVVAHDAPDASSRGLSANGLKQLGAGVLPLPLDSEFWLCPKRDCYGEFSQFAERCSEQAR